MKSDSDLRPTDYIDVILFCSSRMKSDRDRRPTDYIDVIFFLCFIFLLMGARGRHKYYLNWQVNG